MRPKLSFLPDELISRIVSEARDVLARVGVAVHNEEAFALLSGSGAKVDGPAKRVLFPPDLLDKALRTVPRSFKLYDVQGFETNDFSEDKVHFTPGSSTVYILDFENCQSLEKLVLDNEVCGLALRLARGIEPKDD